MDTREIKWLSALEPKNYPQLKSLQEKLLYYYSNDPNYYSYISFTENIWKDSNALVQQDLIRECQKKTKILEIGCGQSFILKTDKIMSNCYTGVDFSDTLINKNKAVYPESSFFSVKTPDKLPFNSQSFDLVFSHFVIEHTVFPNLFLIECKRVLKSGGMLIIVAPDFLGNLGITSQRSGFSYGSGRDKLKKGKYFDTIVTAFDNKVKIPITAFFYRYAAYRKPRFFINLNPTCFIYKFAPDLDAVYLTYENEIKTYLKKHFEFISHNNELRQFIEKHKLIYLKGIKR